MEDRFSHTNKGLQFWIWMKYNEIVSIVWSTWSRLTSSQAPPSLCRKGSSNNKSVISLNLRLGSNPSGVNQRLTFYRIPRRPTLVYLGRTVQAQTTSRAPLCLEEGQTAQAILWGKICSRSNRVTLRKSWTIAWTWSLRHGTSSSIRASSSIAIALKVLEGIPTRIQILKLT